MKNQKNPGLQTQFKIGHLAPVAGLNQFHPLAMTKSFAPARKIPVLYHFALEESVIVKYVAPSFAA